MCKSDYQVGVFPVTKDGKVVLVTTRGSRYWIFPKGKTEKGRCDREVAREEAYEEAGLEGKLKRKYYEFDSLSSHAKKLRLFPMKVKHVKDDYPEAGERERIIVSIKKAEELVQEDLLVVLKTLQKVVA
ncbi:MAG TPA: NUDIX hydrolase [Opitutae bacterium]|nr:NUDIX hydrolase [Opitutae bacterium]